MEEFMTKDEESFEKELNKLMKKYDIFITEDSDEHNQVVFTNEDRTFYFVASTL